MNWLVDKSLFLWYNDTISIEVSLMDTFKIEINIKEESDLYNSFDRYNKTLSEDLISYVSKKLELATIKDQIQIEIISDEKLDEKSIKTTFEEYCDEQLKINAKNTFSHFYDF